MKDNVSSNDFQTDDLRLTSTTSCIIEDLGQVTSEPGNSNEVLTPELSTTPAIDVDRLMKSYASLSVQVSPIEISKKFKITLSQARKASIQAIRKSILRDLK